MSTISPKSFFYPCFKCYVTPKLISCPLQQFFICKPPFFNLLLFRHSFQLLFFINNQCDVCCLKFIKNRIREANTTTNPTMYLRIRALPVIPFYASNSTAFFFISTIFSAISFCFTGGNTFMNGFGLSKGGLVRSTTSIKPLFSIWFTILFTNAICC